MKQKDITIDVGVNDTYYQIYGKNGCIRNDLRYLLVYGGRRSAKSFEVSNAIASTIRQEPNHFVAVCRKVAATCKDSVIARYRNALRAFGLFPNFVKENKTDREFVLPHNNSRIRFFGLDNPEKLKSLEDATIIVMEEFTEFTEEDLNSLDAGLSPSNYNGLIIMIFNPVPLIPGNPHFIQDKFLNKVEKKRGELVIGETTAGSKFGVLNVNYTHNLYCPQETINVMNEYKATNISLYKMWGLGDFTKLEGVIFDDWDVVSFDKIPNNANFIGYGLDFGWTDPTALVGVWSTDTDIWIQALIYDVGLSNEKLYKRMRSNAINVEGFDRIVADGSSPKSIAYLKEAGFHGIRPAKKKKNYKREVAFKMKSYKIHLIELSSIGQHTKEPAPLQKEFSSWCWELDKQGKPLPTPVDGNDHLIDSAIMVCHEYLTNKRYDDIVFSI